MYLKGPQSKLDGSILEVEIKMGRRLCLQLHAASYLDYHLFCTHRQKCLYLERRGEGQSAPAARPQHSLRLRILHGVVFCNLTNEHSLGRSFPCFDMVDPYRRWLTNCLDTRGKMTWEYLHSPPPCRGSTPEAWTLLPYTWSFRSCGQASLHV